jgi:hypothetical protein
LPGLYAGIAGTTAQSRRIGREIHPVMVVPVRVAQAAGYGTGYPGCAVLVTSRTRLAGLDGARLVELDIFEPDQAVELLARVAGPQRVAAEPAAAREIARLCGFLPLAIRVAGARLGARPHWPLSRLEADLTDEHHRLDKLRLGDLEVRASLALSYESLDATAQRAFRLLGLLEIRDFAPWVTAALLDVPQVRAEELVDTLVDMHLLDVAGRDASGRLRYRFHDLLRAYAREVVTAQEPEADRLATLDRAFGGCLALAEEARQCMASSAFAGTFEPGTCWRPDESVVNSVIADPSGWFKAEWAALIGAVDLGDAQAWHCASVAEVLRESGPLLPAGAGRARRFLRPPSGRDSGIGRTAEGYQVGRSSRHHACGGGS